MTATTARGSFSQRLREGRPVVLVNPDHPSASLVEAVGALGADAVMIDCEQGAAGLRDVEDMARAARLTGMSALVRLPAALPWVVERYLGRGIDGVVIPRLDTPAQVAAAVEAVRYCCPRDFDDKTVIVQVESTDAVAALDGFIAAPDVDCLFVGPVDLAKSMGYAGDHARPEVLAVVERVIRRVLDGGRRAGVLAGEHDLSHWRSHGVTMIYTHVNDFLAIGARPWRAAVSDG